MTSQDTSDDRMSQLFAMRAECWKRLEKCEACLSDLRMAMVFAKRSGSSPRKSSGNIDPPTDKNGILQNNFSVFDVLKSKNYKDDWIGWLQLRLEDKERSCKARKSLEENTDDSNPVQPPRDLQIASNAPPNTCRTSGQLRVTSSPEFGHFLKAEKQVEAGQVLMTCKPLAAVLFEGHYHVNCYHCFEPIVTSYPCRDCAGVTYCGAECEEKAWQEYHSFECRYQEFLGEERCAKLGHLTLRLAMLTFTSALKTKQPLPLKPDDNDVSEFYLSSADVIYRELMLLERHETERCDVTNAQMLNICILLYEVLIKSGFIAHFIQNCYNVPLSSVASEEMTSLTRFTLVHLLEMMQVTQCNGFSISKMKDSSDVAASKPRDMGLGLYLFASYLNHSCDPDLDLAFHGNTLHVYSVKQVAAGKQVFCDYGFSFFLDAKTSGSVSYNRTTFSSVVAMRATVIGRCGRILKAGCPPSNAPSALPLSR